jgi:hypothetical protein
MYHLSVSRELGPLPVRLNPAPRSDRVVREEGDEKDGPSVRKPPLSREAKVAYAEIQKGVNQLKTSAAEIHRSLRKAEQRIAADARARLRDLRKEVLTSPSHPAEALYAASSLRVLLASPGYRLPNRARRHSRNISLVYRAATTSPRTRPNQQTSWWGQGEHAV